MTAAEGFPPKAGASARLSGRKCGWLLAHHNLVQHQPQVSASESGVFLIPKPGAQRRRKRSRLLRTNPSNWRLQLPTLQGNQPVELVQLFLALGGAVCKGRIAPSPPCSITSTRLRTC
jgi:hypothetical protein